MGTPGPAFGSNSGLAIESVCLGGGARRFFLGDAERRKDEKKPVRVILQNLDAHLPSGIGRTRGCVGLFYDWVV